MKPDRWRQVDDLFAAALAQAEDQRAAFLDKACVGDSELRLEIEKLLRFDAEAGDFIETPAFDTAAQLILSEPEGAFPGHASVKEKRTKKKSQTSSTSDSIDDARFISGDVLADRYRIVAFLGRGGMGEVYRADDLKLKQSVALKFLPEGLSAEGAALARFYKEVSVARQISHARVCRVYDVGEAAGHHFISMEFVRGEELARLLKRIGRLPQDKALEIARQLCAGLAAIHERGVLHRDLKPANVMIDEHGDVRITDFGIAGLAEEIQGHEALAGTPAYMSPEQLEGGEITRRSDIYSLGLVLYELFTGKRAFEAASVAELIRLRHSDTTPTSPSHLIANLDPTVDRVIFRCLERDPNRRPESALQVASALPGGDPLQGALAAGETPSPEMVAAAPKQGSLRPAVAVSLLASIIIGLTLVIALSGKFALHRFVPLKRSPESLEERAQELVKKLGYTAAATDSAYGFSLDSEYLKYARVKNPSLLRKETLATEGSSAITFWYRQSPGYLEPYNSYEVSISDPPLNLSGMIFMALDTTGRLTYFEAVPPRESGDAQAQFAPPDWSVLFQEAGFDPAGFHETQPGWVPAQNSDVRKAWTGFYPGRPEIPITIEAAAYRSQPVYFEIMSPWRTSSQQSSPEDSAANKARTILMLTLYFGALAVGALLAWRNLRLGRGDRRGAFRLALFTFVIRILYWAVFTHHVPTAGEVEQLFVVGLESAVFWACFIGVMYLALEPFLRRRWPEWIISWSRLLAGDFHDPLVGRDILIGAVFGVCINLARYLSILAPALLANRTPVPTVHSSMIISLGLLGLKGFLPILINQTSAALFEAFIVAFLVLFLSMLLRRNWLGITAGWLLVAALAVLTFSEWSPIGLLFILMIPTLFVFALTRFGLLALISALFFLHLMVFFPVTTEFSAWYASTFILDLLIVLSLAGYGFYRSIAGQPLFRSKFLDD